MSLGKPGTGDSPQPKGAFNRKPTRFHHSIAPGTRFSPEAGRYHLYVSHACPWAHRTLITRALKGLERAIDVSVVHWFLDDRGWSFQPGQGVVPDPHEKVELLRELYAIAAPDHQSRITVPVLWDSKERTIVNNESSEIIRLFDHSFQEIAEHPEVRLSPESLLPAIDAVNAPIYDRVNNGVYKAGFATTQDAYEHAVIPLFAELDRLDALLTGQRWLLGDRFTEADVRLFTTLLRFDPVYHTHFKCSVRRLSDYEALWAYTREIAQDSRIRPTIHLDHITKHYYASHKRLNPTGIVAALPAGFDLDQPHDRAALGGDGIPGA